MKKGMILVVLAMALLTGCGEKGISSSELKMKDGIAYTTDGKPYTGKVTSETIEQGFYVDGKKDGEWIYLYKNGNTAQKGSYKDGKEVGEWLGYYESGELNTKGNFVDGKEEGEWKTYAKTGELTKKTTYKDGNAEVDFDDFEASFESLFD